MNMITNHVKETMTENMMMLATITWIGMTITMKIIEMMHYHIHRSMMTTIKWIMKWIMTTITWIMMTMRMTSIIIIILGMVVMMKMSPVKTIMTMTSSAHMMQDVNHKGQLTKAKCESDCENYISLILPEALSSCFHHCSHALNTTTAYFPKEVWKIPELRSISHSVCVFIVSMSFALIVSTCPLFGFSNIQKIGVISIFVINLFLQILDIVVKPPVFSEMHNSYDEEKESATWFVAVIWILGTYWMDG